MNIENVQEAVEAGIEAITIDIPIRVTMTSYNNAPFEFIPSIDEVGQIVLTPTSKDVEFIDANTDITTEFDVPVIEQETIELSEGAMTTKEMSIIIKAGLLAEVENYDFSAVVDEIGQVVIYPLADNNSFVTASFEDSLNLVTEDMKTVEYFGYKFINTGDGWDVYDYTNDLIEEGVATLAEAKILACTAEIHKLEELTEDVNKLEEEPVEVTEQETPQVEAEVIEEAVTDATAEIEKFNSREVEEALEKITDNFKQDSGAVRCDTMAEQRDCLRILSLHYDTIVDDKKDDQWIVSYSGLIHTTEDNLKA